MKLTKIVPARRKTIEFNWCKRDFTKMSERYRAIRSKSSNPMDKCGWCGYPFENGQMMALAQVKGRRNMVLCQECADELLTTTVARLDQREKVTMRPGTTCDRDRFSTGGSCDCIPEGRGAWSLTHSERSHSMKKLVALFIVSLLAVGSAQAVEFSSLNIGPQLTLRENGDATVGPDLSGFVALTPRLTLEGAYFFSGEGAEQSLARLGAHYAVWGKGYEPSRTFNLTLGGGVMIKALGVEHTESGGFLSVGIQSELPTVGEWRFGVDVNGSFERDPKPNLTIRSAKVFRF